MSEVVVPTAASVKSMLSAMYGEDLDVDAATEDAVDDHHAATYIADDGALLAVCTCDDAFVVHTGAALSMLPPNVAQEMVSEKNISDVVLANFHEVMNIFSRLLMSDTSPHLRLDKTLSPDSASPVVKGLETRTKVVFDVRLANYGTGRVCFLVA